MRHLINAIEESLKSENWYAALTLSLTLPDICGKISFNYPSGKQRYAEWSAKYVGDKYKFVLSGEDCYALRCAFLREGTAFTGNQKASKDIENFIFVASSSSRIHINILAGSLQLDVTTFCKDVCDGVRVWMGDSHPSIFMPNVLNILSIQEGDEVRFGSNGIEIVQPDGRERWGLTHQTDPSNIISLEDKYFYDSICNLLKPIMILHNVAAITPFKSGAYVGYSENGEFNIYGLRFARPAKDYFASVLDGFGVNRSDFERLSSLQGDEFFESIRKYVEAMFVDLNLISMLPFNHHALIGSDSDDESSAFLIRGFQVTSKK